MQHVKEVLVELMALHRIHVGMTRQTVNQVPFHGIPFALQSAETAHGKQQDKVVVQFVVHSHPYCNPFVRQRVTIAKT